MSQKTVADCLAILRQLRSVRHSLPRTVVSSIVLQQLDYGNTTLAGNPYHLIKRMQFVMKSAARLMFSASRYDRITPLLTQLHWLKVSERIEFKLTVLAFRCLHKTASSYLARELYQSSAVEACQSASPLCFVYIAWRTTHPFSTIADQAFRSLLPTVEHCRRTSIRRRRFLFY